MTPMTQSSLQKMLRNGKTSTGLGDDRRVSRLRPCSHPRVRSHYMVCLLILVAVLMSIHHRTRALNGPGHIHLISGDDDQGLASLEITIALYEQTNFVLNGQTLLAPLEQKPTSLASVDYNNDSEESETYSRQIHMLITQQNTTVDTIYSKMRPYTLIDNNYLQTILPGKVNDNQIIFEQTFCHLLRSIIYLTSAFNRYAAYLFSTMKYSMLLTTVVSCGLITRHKKRNLFIKRRYLLLSKANIPSGLAVSVILAIMLHNPNISPFIKTNFIEDYSQDSFNTQNTSRQHFSRYMSKNIDATRHNHVGQITDTGDILTIDRTSRDHYKTYLTIYVDQLTQETQYLRLKQPLNDRKQFEITIGLEPKFDNIMIIDPICDCLMDLISLNMISENSKSDQYGVVAVIFETAHTETSEVTQNPNDLGNGLFLLSPWLEFLFEPSESARYRSRQLVFDDTDDTCQIEPCKPTRFLKDLGNRVFSTFTWSGQCYESSQSARYRSRQVFFEDKIVFGINTNVIFRFSMMTQNNLRKGIFSMNSWLKKSPESYSFARWRSRQLFLIMYGVDTHSIACKSIDIQNNPRNRIFSTWLCSEKCAQSSGIARWSSRKFFLKSKFRVC